MKKLNGLEIVRFIDLKTSPKCRHCCYYLYGLTFIKKLLDKELKNV
jgi:hypothetical protein